MRRALRTWSLVAANLPWAGFCAVFAFLFGVFDRGGGAAEVLERDAPGERLRGLAKQLRGRAAEQQKARGSLRAIGEHAQHRKWIEEPLNFVDHAKPTQGPERQSRFREASAVGRTLEVEHGRWPAMRAGCARCSHACEACSRFRRSVRVAPTRLEGEHRANVTARPESRHRDTVAKYLDAR